MVKFKWRKKSGQTFVRGLATRILTKIDETPRNSIFPAMQITRQSSHHMFATTSLSQSSTSNQSANKGNTHNRVKSWRLSVDWTSAEEKRASSVISYVLIDAKNDLSMIYAIIRKAAKKCH